MRHCLGQEAQILSLPLVYCLLGRRPLSIAFWSPPGSRAPLWLLAFRLPSHSGCGHRSMQRSLMCLPSQLEPRL